MKRFNNATIMDEGKCKQMHDGGEQCGGSTDFERQHWTGCEPDTVDFGKKRVQNKANGDQQTGQRIGGGQIQTEQEHRRFVVNFEVANREQGGIQENAHQTADYEQRTHVDIERLGDVVRLMGVLEDLLDLMFITIVHGYCPV